MNNASESALKTSRFGEVIYATEDVVEFPEGLLGFEHLQRFVTLRTPQASAFRWLQSLDDPAIAFLVTDPRNYVQDYDPKAIYADNRLVYTTVNIPHGKPQDMTINLAGPIVIDVETRLGRQTVLEGEAYTTRYRVFAKESRPPEDIAA